jgi:hypothetical protein
VILFYSLVFVDLILKHMADSGIVKVVIVTVIYLILGLALSR